MPDCLNVGDRRECISTTYREQKINRMRQKDVVYSECILLMICIFLLDVISLATYARDMNIRFDLPIAIIDQIYVNRYIFLRLPFAGHTLVVSSLEYNDRHTVKEEVGEWLPTLFINKRTFIHQDMQYYIVNKRYLRRLYFALTWVRNLYNENIWNRRRLKLNSHILF